MNEGEWFSEADYLRHVRFAEGRLSLRKQRLLAAALCRSVLHLHESESRLIEAVEYAEEFADGNRSLQELEARRQQCRELASRANQAMVHMSETRPVQAMQWELLTELAWAASYAATTPVSVEAVSQKVAIAVIQVRTGSSDLFQLQRDAPLAHHNLTEAESRALRSLVWEVVGNPFSESEFRSEWRTSTTTALARGMYDSRDFSAMPILADALQDAGCESEDLLEHCRSSERHVRGCWVVDRLLDLR
jgi:hypothetical protein